jgi:hypothetical protein
VILDEITPKWAVFAQRWVKWEREQGAGVRALIDALFRVVTDAQCRCRCCAVDGIGVDDASGVFPVFGARAVGFFLTDKNDTKAPWSTS